MFHTISEIKTGNARCHALIQVDLCSFDQNIFGFKDLKKKLQEKVLVLWMINSCSIQCHLKTTRNAGEYRGLTVQEVSQNQPKRSLRTFSVLRHPNHFLLVGVNNQEVIIANDSMRFLVFEIFFAVYWLHISTVSISKYICWSYSWGCLLERNTCWGQRDKSQQTWHCGPKTREKEGACSLT